MRGRFAYKHCDNKSQKHNWNSEDVEQSYPGCDTLKMGTHEIVFVQLPQRNLKYQIKEKVYFS